MKSCLMLVSFPTSFFLQAWRVAPREGVACQAYTSVSPPTDGLCSHAQWTTLETWFTGKVNSVIQADSPQVYCGIVQFCSPLQNTKASLARQLSWPNTVSLVNWLSSLSLLRPWMCSCPRLSPPQAPDWPPMEAVILLTYFFRVHSFSKSRTLNQVTMGTSAMQRRQGSHAVGNEMAGKEWDWLFG